MPPLITGVNSIFDFPVSDSDLITTFLSVTDNPIHRDSLEANTLADLTALENSPVNEMMVVKVSGITAFQSG
ncbi:hypothetical protein SDC9_192288 [bioreactor metagenome]|uniref:Uncharacterized protein n=1 Tax=bioreactor metagenome TaxID=1076179 RepID=A0A645IBC5_9ZZZZ